MILPVIPAASQDRQTILQQATQKTTLIFPTLHFQPAKQAHSLVTFIFVSFSPKVHSDTITMSQLLGPSNLKPVEVTLRQTFR